MTKAGLVGAQASEGRRGKKCNAEIPFKSAEAWYLRPSPKLNNMKKNGVNCFSLVFFRYNAGGREGDCNNNRYRFYMQNRFSELKCSFKKYT